MEVSIDLETMGTSANAPIIAIGAVLFDLNSGELGPSFYANIDLASAITSGATLDAATVVWWMQQSDEARSALSRPGRPISEVLTQFSAWLSLAGEDPQVWGNGPSFDCAILAESYRRCLAPVPWKFWNERCLRTYRSLRPYIPALAPSVKHHALEDARCQAQHVIDIHKTLRA